MRVYFVRHGTSTLTEAKHQLPDTRLSELGVKQADAVSRRFAHVPIDIVLTSSYARALQTAQAIENVRRVPLVQSDLLIERKMPSQFLGRAVDDPEVTPVHQAIRKHFYDLGWHYADEENMFDLLSRARAALNLIISQEKGGVVVVTHGYFLTVLVFCILFGETADPRSFQSFRNHTSNSNAGITLCEYTDGKWRLVTWNDCSHLGI